MIKNVNFGKLKIKFAYNSENGERIIFSPNSVLFLALVPLKYRNLVQIHFLFSLIEGTAKGKARWILLKRHLKAMKVKFRLR